MIKRDIIVCFECNRNIAKLERAERKIKFLEFKVSEKSAIIKNKIREIDRLYEKINKLKEVTQ